MLCPTFETQIVLDSINPFIINNSSKTSGDITISTISTPFGFNLTFNQYSPGIISGNTEKVTDTINTMIPSITLQINGTQTVILITLTNGQQKITEVILGQYKLKIIYTYTCNHRQHYWTILNISLSDKNLS